MQQQKQCIIAGITKNRQQFETAFKSMVDQRIIQKIKSIRNQISQHAGFKNKESD